MLRAAIDGDDDDDVNGQVRIYWWHIITVRPFRNATTWTWMFTLARAHSPANTELPIDMFLSVCVRFICLQCLWIIMEKPLRDSCLCAHIQPNPIAFQFSNKFDNEWNDYLLIYLYCCCCYCYFYFYGFRLCVSSFLHVFAPSVLDPNHSFLRPVPPLWRTHILRAHSV